MSALTTHATLAGGKPHVKVYLTDGATSYERCEDAGCTVDRDGHASCGRAACPACGLGGSNLSAPDGFDGDSLVRCLCGHLWFEPGDA
jgi:hypothetical protein